MGSLFNFNTLITPRVMKLLFVVGVVFTGLLSLAIVKTGFSFGAAAGFLGLFVAAAFFFVGVITSRVSCECILVMFMIRSELAHMRQSLTSASLNSNP